MDTIIHTYETTTSIHWLEFDHKPDEGTRAILKGQGWRWSGAAGKWRKAGLLTKLPELPGYEYEEAGAADYSAERAEYYESRADRATERANAAHSRADAIAGMIPFGQPILVGHHSERRHRRDLGKIEADMRKAIEEREKAGRLNYRAEAAERHQSEKQDPGAIARRLEKIRQDLANTERIIANYRPAETREDWELVGATITPLEEYERRRAVLKQEITRLEVALEVAGGIPADSTDLQKGDLILIHGHLVEVIRVNKKTIGGYLAGPMHNLFSKESGYTKRTERNAQKWDRSRFQSRIYTATEWAKINEGRTQAEAYAVAEARRKNTAE